MQGASPLAFPGLNPGGTGAGGVSRAGGGACPGVARSTCRRCLRWGGLPSLPPAYPAFSLFFLPPIPRPPSPAGKGETQSLFRRGLRPRHPGIKPLAALTEPAKQVPSGGELARHCRLPPPPSPAGGLLRRCLLALPLMSPAGGLAPALPARPAGAVPGGGGGRGREVRQRRGVAGGKGGKLPPVAAPCKKIFKSP